MTTTLGVRCWGDNDVGQLGDGTTTSRSVPPAVDVLTGVQAVVTGFGHTCALTTTGGVRCWGDNTVGQLGDDTTTSRSVPPAVDVLTGVQAIAAGGNYTCVVMLATGGVRCWGANDSGQLGDGTFTSHSAPPASDVLTGAKAIATGIDHTCALMTTGGVRCWGLGANGQLGNDYVEYRVSPRQVLGTCK
jgi:alpha-tubulin suppressor-like RCC1 family protein